MSMKPLLIVLALIAATSIPSRAEDFKFTVSGTVYDAIDDQYNNQPGTISGELIGLTNNASSFPSLIVIDSQPDIFDLPHNFPIAPGVVTTNDGVTTTGGAGFTVTDGQITAADATFSYQPSGYGGMQAAAELDFGTTIFSSDSEFPGPTFVNNAGFSAVTFTPIPVVVPEPSAYALLLLGGAALFVRRSFSAPARIR